MAEVIRVAPKQPNLVLAATANGLLYRSLDGGQSWAHRYFPAQFAGTLHALEVDPRRPGTWYAGMESDNPGLAGVHKTEDGGATWKPLPGMRGKAVWALAVWPANPDIIAAGTGEGVFLSRDAGASWARISPESNRDLRPVVSLAFHPADSRHDLRRHHTPALADTGWRRRLGVHPLRHARRFRRFQYCGRGTTPIHGVRQRVQRSLPQRATAAAPGGGWPTPRGAFRAYLVSLDPQTLRRGLRRHQRGPAAFGGRGRGWQRVSQHAVKSIAFDPANPRQDLLCVGDGRLLVSRDGGNTLLESNIGFSNRNFAAMCGFRAACSIRARVYEPGSGGIFRTDDGGCTWRPHGEPRR